MEFTHESTAYILRWNKPDYKEIIGVFKTMFYLESFIYKNFTSEECVDILFGEKSFKIERGRYYSPKQY